MLLVFVAVEELLQTEALKPVALVAEVPVATMAIAMAMELSMAVEPMMTFEAVMTKAVAAVSETTVTKSAVAELAVPEMPAAMKAAMAEPAPEAATAVIASAN